VSLGGFLDENKLTVFTHGAAYPIPIHKFSGGEIRIRLPEALAGYGER
jgi:hypothetical protein